jgi:hypothetical protein
MGCFNSSHTAAALPTVLLGHGVFGYLADPGHDVLAARPRTVLLGIAEVTSRAAGQA